MGGGEGAQLCALYGFNFKSTTYTGVNYRLKHINLNEILDLNSIIIIVAQPVGFHAQISSIICNFRGNFIKLQFQLVAELFII